MIRRLRNLFLLLAGLLIAGVAALVGLARVYDAEVKVQLVGALNQQLLAPVTVEDMDLTLLARFPKASMRLSQVLVREVRYDDATPDTLLSAGQLHLEFSLWDLFKGRYTVERIHGEDVRCYPALDGEGRENYLIWKTDSAATASSGLELDAVTFDGLRTRFRDARSGTEIATQSRSLALRGRFSEAGNALQVQGDADLLHWAHGKDVLLKDRQAQMRLELAFGGPAGDFRITKGEVVVNDVPLELTLVVQDGKQGQELDLRANGLDLDLARTVGILPDELQRPFLRYGIKGDVDLAVHYAGPISGKGPALSIGAQVERGRITEKRSGMHLSDIRCDLAMDLTPEGTPRNLVVKGFTAQGLGGSITGNWRSNGLTNATVKAELRTDIALADLLRFAQVDTLEHASGRLTANARVEGRLRDVADVRPADLRAVKVTGMASLRDATLKLKGLRHRAENVQADLVLDGSNADIQRLEATIQGNAFRFEGTLRNLVPYLLFDDQKLLVEARASSPRIDLAGLLQAAGTDGTSNNTGYTLTLPSSIDLDLKAKVDELVFEDFTATAINGTLRMKDRTLRLSPLTFNTASGAVLGSLELDARDSSRGGYPLAIQATCQDIDIAELFREFQDFGQDFIGHRHLSGRTNAQVTLHAPLSPDLHIDMQRLVCGADVTITNGALKGHQPLLQVADHVRSNRMIAPFVNTAALRDKLADVRFARLQNSISIRDGAVHIPLMEVKSSAMDIELSGTHHFDDRIDHHLNFRLGDLFRVGKPTKDEFGPLADDGTGMRIFLHMYGTASNPQFANDGAMASARRKQQIQQEKEELRAILREDLGLFGGGTGGTLEPNKPNTDTRITVEWEGADTSRTAGAQPNPGTVRKPPKPKDPEERERIIIED